MFKMTLASIVLVCASLVGIAQTNIINTYCWLLLLL